MRGRLRRLPDVADTGSAPQGHSSSIARYCPETLLYRRKLLILLWRRGWDSNPRAPYGTRRFRGAPVTTTSVPLRAAQIAAAELSILPEGGEVEGQTLAQGVPRS
jgi:hypothetical protein